MRVFEARDRKKRREERERKVRNNEFYEEAVTTVLSKNEN